MRGWHANSFRKCCKSKVKEDLLFEDFEAKMVRLEDLQILRFWGTNTLRREEWETKISISKSFKNNFPINKYCGTKIPRNERYEKNVKDFKKWRFSFMDIPRYEDCETKISWFENSNVWRRDKDFLKFIFWDHGFDVRRFWDMKSGRNKDC